MNSRVHPSPHLELAQCIRSSFGDDFAGKASALFIASLPKDRLTINQAFEVKNWNVLLFQVEKLLDVSLYFEVPALQSALRELMDAIRIQAPIQAKVWIHHASKEIDIILQMSD